MARASWLPWPWTWPSWRPLSGLRMSSMGRSRFSVRPQSKRRPDLAPLAGRHVVAGCGHGHGPPRRRWPCGHLAMRPRPHDPKATWPQGHMAICLGHCGGHGQWHGHCGGHCPDFVCHPRDAAVSASDLGVNDGLILLRSPSAMSWHGHGPWPWASQLRAVTRASCWRYFDFKFLHP